MRITTTENSKVCKAKMHTKNEKKRKIRANSNHKEQSKSCENLKDVLIEWTTQIPTERNEQKKQQPKQTIEMKENNLITTMK